MTPPKKQLEQEAEEKLQSKHALVKTETDNTFPTSSLSNEVFYKPDFPPITEVSIRYESSFRDNHQDQDSSWTDCTPTPSPFKKSKTYGTIFPTEHNPKHIFSTPSNQLSTIDEPTCNSS